MVTIEKKKKKKSSKKEGSFRRPPRAESHNGGGARRAATEILCFGKQTKVEYKYVPGEVAVMLSRRGSKAGGREPEVRERGDPAVSGGPLTCTRASTPLATLLLSSRRVDALNRIHSRAKLRIINSHCPRLHAKPPRALYDRRGPSGDHTWATLDRRGVYGVEIRRYS